jgi:hypothetical protein
VRVSAIPNRFRGQDFRGSFHNAPIDIRRFDRRIFVNNELQCRWTRLVAQGDRAPVPRRSDDAAAPIEFKFKRH